MVTSSNNITARANSLRERTGSESAAAGSQRSPQPPHYRRAERVARAMVKDRVGPRGLGSGIRMIQFYLDRAENLPAAERSELELAQEILRRQLQEQQA